MPAPAEGTGVPTLISLSRSLSIPPLAVGLAQHKHKSRQNLGAAGASPASARVSPSRYRWVFVSLKPQPRALLRAILPLPCRVSYGLLQQYFHYLTSQLPRKSAPFLVGSGAARGPFPSSHFPAPQGDPALVWAVELCCPFTGRDTQGLKQKLFSRHRGEFGDSRKSRMGVQDARVHGLELFC